MDATGTFQSELNVSVNQIWNVSNALKWVLLAGTRSY